MSNKPVAWMYRIKDTDNRWELIFNKPTTDGFFDTVPLYTHPVKELHLSLQKDKETGELLAVTYTDDEHRIVEVLWERPPVKELTDEEIIESLAELEHQQWMKWADAIMQTEKISDVRFARWASCMIPYAELSEEMKEHDKVWARQALAILRKAQEK